jgi:hypothetical protein
MTHMIDSIISSYRLAGANHKEGSAVGPHKGEGPPTPLDNEASAVMPGS